MLAPSALKKQRLDDAAGTTGIEKALKAAALGAPSSAAASGGANPPSDPTAAASGAPPELTVAVYEMLRLESHQAHEGYLTRWATAVKTYVNQELPKIMVEPPRTDYFQHSFEFGDVRTIGDRR